MSIHRSLGRKRVIPYSNIRWIDLQQETHSTLIRLKEGGTVQIRGDFTEGESELYPFLRSAWEEVSERVDASQFVMSRREFSALYERFRKHMWPTYLILGLALGSMLGAVITLFIYTRNQSLPAAYLSVGFIVLMFLVLGLGVWWQKSVLDKKYGFLCPKCETSMTLESGKTILSTGKCPNCNALLISPTN